ncbi:MAG: hypothetical protein ACRDOK_26600 [Streptosporangiaceae bacterium]
MRKDLAAGWHAVRAAPDVLLVLGTFIAALVAASGFLAVGLHAWVARAHGGPGTLGLLQGAAGIAELAGALALARLRLRRMAMPGICGAAADGRHRPGLRGHRHPPHRPPADGHSRPSPRQGHGPVVHRHRRRDHHQPAAGRLAIRAWGLTASFALSGAALIALSGLSLLRLARRHRAAATPRIQ